MEQLRSDIKTSEKEKGVLTLMSVLIAGAIGLAVGVSLILLGLAYSRTGFSLQQSSQAKALVNACAEEALQQIRSSSGYSGTGNLTLGQGSCSYTASNTGGETRKIINTGTVGTIVRKVQISVSAVNPLIIISSWQEVADFN